MSNISKFKSIADFARPNLFKVSISQTFMGVENEEFFINCFQANVPGLNIATTNKDQAYRSIAYQKIYEDITLGFYCSADMKELKYLQNWMNKIIRPQDNHVEYYTKYIGTINIINLGLNPSKLFKDQNEKIMTTEILEAYPKTISSFAMDYGTTGSIISVTATFTYRTYTQTYGDGEIISTNRGNFTETSAEDISDPLSDINTLKDKTGNLVKKNAQGFFVPAEHST